MKFIKTVINFLLFFQTCQIEASTMVCSCSQLKSQGDCVLNKDCQWNKINHSCRDRDSPSAENSTIPAIKYPTYCDQFGQNDCSQLRTYDNFDNYAACAWENDKCVFFTDCTVYDSKTEQDCQLINHSCITDGNHCVQISACDQYKKQRSCQKNDLGQYCFWNNINNECEIADTCYKLPTLLKNDKECRDNIKTCTSQMSGGCIESGLNCIDQKQENQCVWNQNQTMACFWDGSLCKDRICSNAPIQITSDDGCMQFRKDGTCTTKENGGCVTRTSCQAAKIREACIKNAEGFSCFWDGQNCLDKICQNAPKTLITNSECEEFQAGCITTLQGGCVQNRSCSAANTLIACYKNLNGYPCIWYTFKGYEGCYEKTCENAPTSLLTNEECEAYLQGHNCITQTGGGCTTQTICEAIKVEAACIQDIYGIQCNWDKINLNCKRKSCWYPKQNDSGSSSLNRLLSASHTITQNYCQSFSDTCIANSTNTECIEKRCEDSLLQTDCFMDVLSNKACVWIDKCYQKQCVFASKATTHQECQAYLVSCTLSNSGLGCVPLPIICQSITNANSCVKKANGQLCGWDGFQCINKSCSTASNSIKTTQECQQYLPQCVANNPIKMNGISVIMGCQDLFRNCRQRMSIENCEIQRNGYPICLWNATQNQCIEKSCQTASIQGTSNSVTQFTFQNCLNYLSDNSCISNNNSDGCIQKQQSCRNLVYQNCQLGSKIIGDCYWNGLECVDRICENLRLTTHNDCNGQQIECTVNNQKTGCQRLAFQCSDYSDYENCKLTSERKYCIWTGSVCRSATCFDAPDSLLFDTDEECSNYQSNEKCTVINKVGGQGCIKKQINCSDYKISGQCHKTVQNQTTKDDCKWIIDKCYSIQQLISQPCSMLKGSKQMCQKFNDGCTNTDQANSLTPCFVDCQLKIGSKLIFEDCQKLDVSCSVKIDGTGCINIQPTCQAYGSQSIGCVRSSAISTQSYCVMNTATPPYCQTITQASECTFVSSQPSLDHEKCQAYSSFCTYLSNGSGCQEYKNTCNLYSSDLQHCTISKQGKCYFDGTECVRFLMCSSIIGTGLTNEQCLSYNQGCTSNANGTACQLKQARCDLYLSQNSCTLSSASTNKCVWTGDVCISIVTSLVSTHCLYVIGTQLTDTLCSTYNIDCTITADGTACQRKQATCDLYFTKNSCTFSKATGSASKCVWNAKACLAITSTNVETHCAYIIGNNLTDAICSSYYSGCTVNRSGLACQYMLSACNKYTNITACSKSSAQKCVWNPDASPAQCIGVTAATQCILITSTIFNDTECSSYNALCVANSTAKACQEKKATCNIYTTSESCSTSTAGKCYWNSVAMPQVCIQISNASALCIQVIQPFPLSKEICATFNVGCTVNSLKTGCQELENTCDLYLTQTTCSFSKAKSPADRCVWNTEVSPAVCITITNATQCTLILGSGFDNTQCSAYFASCTNLKDGTGCQEKKAYCKNYSTQNTCVMQNDGLSCLWFEKACYQIRTLACTSITGLGLDHSTCQSFNISCTSMADGTSCQEFKSTCEQYLGANSCTKTANSKCYQDKQKCITISNTATDCSKITGTQGTLTYQFCQSYNIGCSVNRLKSGCIQQQQQCSDYGNNIQNCYQSKAGLCTSNSTADNNCIAVSQITNCENLYLGDGNYNHSNCNEMKNGCTVNGIIGCTQKTCGNAIGPFNHENCNNWLNSCTVYIGKSGCITMKQKCMDQQASQCLNSFEGECIVIGQQCLKKTCDTAPSDTTNDDDSECSGYLQSCTVARLGGCQPRDDCSSYISQNQCKLNSSNEKCFWNKIIQNCVDLKCENIEATISYDSHGECYAVDQQLACTVKASEGIAIAGCMSRVSCDSYTIEEQCVTNQNGDVCVWNTNQSLEKPQCQDKSCTTAPFSISTHYDCYSYYNTPTIQCTVALNFDKDGILKLSGCQTITSCQSYQNIEQCKINDKGKPCEWQQSQCLEKSCETAPQTIDYDSDTKCKNYFGDKCTVASTGFGCTTIPLNCEEMTKEQCFYNIQGNPCFWTGDTCITRTCDNAPESMLTPEKCESYLSGCTIDNIKCKIKICEHYHLTTDNECTQVMSTCTTNGKFCVQRGTCLESQSEAGCIISSKGEQCQWINAEENRQGYCTIKSCLTAPNNLKTEEQCSNYFNNCTTKYGGGCITKSTCLAALIDSACKRDINNKICVWDSTENRCRYQECIDINGTSHIQCKIEKSGCTVGLNGKCAKIQTCELTTIRDACIEGINGPCLWIEDKNNQAKGTCIKYTSCKSVTWNTDKQCKLISNKCTTNGLNCIGITLCSETNTNGGCVTGYDGVCAQSTLNQNNVYSKICSLESSFSCQTVSYITHIECQNYSIKCTTNGTECISLMSCAQYNNQSGCYLNKAGQILDNSNNIISTGICTWESSISACRDQNCFDLIGNNHQSCYDQLFNCTSNGSTCITIQKCAYHQTQTACIVAKSLDGPCFWEQDSNLCRPLICSDIKNVSITTNCQLILPSCVSDGTNCVPKSNCSLYKTKTSCYSYGLDGPCLFYNNQYCKLITDCAVAQYQQACEQVQKQCYWVPKSDNIYQSNVCQAHTCATYYTTFRVCNFFLRFNQQTKVICQLKNNSCIEADQYTFIQTDCYVATGYSFTWNSMTSKCESCFFYPNNQSNSNLNNVVNYQNTKAYLLVMMLAFQNLLFA
ncbi:unnamed protein product [Paramecium sonneborni]|uniref:PSI domain-containing protein n=1 Tax=Paramecium sonneborni TaxID=65129 RepID=A0A8S1QZ90_9CILI|nr:unnamed protein product [Paramecium sonneborni]